MSATTRSQNVGGPMRVGPALPLRAEIGRQLRRRRTVGIFIVLFVLPLASAVSSILPRRAVRTW